MADNVKRRDFLTIATGGMAVVGGGLAAWPLIQQGNPNPSDIPDFLDVDLRGILVGAERTIFWKGNPYFVRRRTDAELAALQAVNVADLRDQDSRNENFAKSMPALDENRAVPGMPNFVIVSGQCPHLSIVLQTGHRDSQYPRAVYNCPVCSARFDGSGRKLGGGPAQTNLPVPRYAVLPNGVLRLGDDRRFRESQLENLTL